MAREITHLSWCETKKSGCWCESQRYAFVLVLGILVFVFQVIGGYLAGSVAIYADSAHVASDTVATGLSLYVALRARSHADEHRMRSGYARISAGILVLALLWIVYEAFERLNAPQTVDGPLVIAVAGAGLVINLIQFQVLHPERTATANLQRLHILQDALSSVAVVLGGVAIWLFHVSWIDPVLSIGLVVWTGVPALRVLAGKSHGHVH